MEVPNQVVLTCTWGHIPLNKHIIWSRKLKGNDQLEAFWIFQGNSEAIRNEPLIPGLSRFKKTAQSNYVSSHTLLLSKSSIDDEGEYSCKVNVTEIKDYSSVTIFVHVFGK